MLGFILDHIEPTETYRLGKADLAFGELLPAKPGWLKQDEYKSGRLSDSNSSGW